MKLRFRDAFWMENQNFPALAVDGEGRQVDALASGSVWPHDTMLAAEGMAAYGLTAQARTVAAGIRDAAMHFGNSLPELFGGFSRADFPVPVRYHHAGSPQAWAAAAGLAPARLAPVRLAPARPA